MNPKKKLSPDSLEDFLEPTEGLKIAIPASPSDKPKPKKKKEKASATVRYVRQYMKNMTDEEKKTMFKEI